MARLPDHHSRVTEKDVTGIGVPREAAMSRTAFALRLFCRLGASSFGRPGGRGRKARRSFPGTPTPVRSAHPIGLGLAVHNRNWSNIMCRCTISSDDDPAYPFSENQQWALYQARHLSRLLCTVAQAKDSFVDLNRESLAVTFGLLSDLLESADPTYDCPLEKLQ